MRIDGFTLRRYIPLENSGITSINVECEADVQIIIGTNGSGKSSLLRILAPVCFPKTIFEKSGSNSSGYREIRYSGDRQYKAISDYSKPSSPHSFVVEPDDVELNEGGASAYQEELMQTELGIDRLTRDLMMHNIKFSSMSSTPRKALMMEINPDKIGFVFDLQKQTASKIKACKSNLVRLQDRKLQLEQELLSQNEVEELRREAKRLNTSLEAIQEYLHKLNIGRAKLPTLQRGRVSEAEISGVRAELVQLEKKLYRYTNVPRSHEEIDLACEDMRTKIGVLDGRRQSIDEEITARGHDLQQHRITLDALTDDDRRGEIDTRIVEIEKTIAEIPDRKLAYQLSEEEVLQLERQIPALRETLEFFIRSSETILTTPKYRKKTQYLSYWTGMRQMWRHTLESRQEERDRLEAQIRIRPEDIPTDNCAKDACPLFRAFMPMFDRRASELAAIRNDIRILEHRIARADHYLEHQRRQIDAQRPCREKMHDLTQMAKSNPILRDVLHEPDILNRLRHHPIGIIRTIDEHCTDLRLHWKKQALQKELTSLYIDLSKIKASGDGSRESLEAYIQKEENALDGLLSRLVTIRQERQELTNRMTQYQEFDAIMRALSDSRKHLELLAETIHITHESDLIAYMEEQLKTTRQDMLGRLGDINTTIRNQDIVFARYKEEVVDQIAIIEKERAILMSVMDGLEEIPRVYLIPFLNDVVTQMNYLIELIWTQDVRVLPFALDDDLNNYLFAFNKDGRKIPDLSLGSEGEQELFNLVFNIAVRIVRDIRDYPLLLDEAGRTFDEQHKQNLIRLLNGLIDDRIISQLFLVNHHATIHEGFPNSEILVLKEDNIVLPDVYNKHVQFDV